MRFAQIAARPWSREDLDRLTEEEEQALLILRDECFQEKSKPPECDLK